MIFVFIVFVNKKLKINHLTATIKGKLKEVLHNFYLN